MFLFGFFNTCSTIAVLIYNLLQFKKGKEMLGGVAKGSIDHFSKKKNGLAKKTLGGCVFWFILETILITAAQYYVSGYMNTPFGNLFDTGANYFGLVLVSPFLVMLVCALLNVDFLARMDLITPAYPLALVFVKIACHFGCCCRGFEWEKGIYNPVSRLVEFPAPLLESAMALLIFIFLLCVRKKMKKGVAFPVYLMVYSATRFFTEFTRCEPSVFMGLKMYQLLCIGAMIVGVVEYYLVCKHVKRTDKK